METPCSTRAGKTSGATEREKRGPASPVLWAAPCTSGVHKLPYPRGVSSVESPLPRDMGQSLRHWPRPEDLCAWHQAQCGEAGLSKPWLRAASTLRAQTGTMEGGRRQNLRQPVANARRQEGRRPVPQARCQSSGVMQERAVSVARPAASGSLSPWVSWVGLTSPPQSTAPASPWAVATQKDDRIAPRPPRLQARSRAVPGSSAPSSSTPTGHPTECPWKSTPGAGGAPC